jgi:hypothetical protein
MSTPLVQTLFSDTTLAIIATTIKALLPDEFDWIADTAQVVLSTVDDIDAIEATGEAKTATILTIVTNALDLADDVPGWSELQEEQRDALLGGLTGLAVATLRFAQGGKITDEIVDLASDSVAALLKAAWALSKVKKAKPPSLIAKAASDRAATSLTAADVLAALKR